jgi:pimeloyl-ACP methyl ester carboxylesterase
MSHALFTELDGHRIAYETRGRGDGAIVFVHGWTSGRWQWRAQMERDDWNRRLLALDLPGHGDSDKPDVRYSMTFFARAAAAAMDAAGIARAVLVGHSNGVPVIRQFYRLHPERTEGLVAVDGALRGLPPERMQWFRAAVERPDYEEFLRKMIEQGPRMVGSDADWERIKEGQLAMPRHVMLGGIDAMADPSVWTEDPIAVPLLVMVAQPQLVGDDYEAFVRRLAPHAEYQRWEHASHFFPLEQAERFNAAVRTWLGGLSSQASPRSC